MRSFVMAGLISLTAALPGAMAGELLGDPTAGRKLAEDVCSACHVIAVGHMSTTNVDAPAFPDLANTPRVTALSLRVFLQTPHKRMPDFHLGRDETDDVIAYILTMKE